MKNYLANRKQRGRVNITFSEWEIITTGVPQVSTILTILTYFQTIFFFSSQTPPRVIKLGNTLYILGNNMKRVKENLRKSLRLKMSEKLVKINLNVLLLALSTRLSAFKSNLQATLNIFPLTYD